MAKFAVGDLVQVIACNIPQDRYLIGKQGVVTGLGQWAHGDTIRDGRCNSPDGGEILVQLYGHHCENVWHEHELRKLPPDDHAADTTEEPGLTRLKKLLEQDTVPHKQPKREKA